MLASHRDRSDIATTGSSIYNRPILITAKSSRRYPKLVPIDITYHAERRHFHSTHVSGCGQPDLAVQQVEAQRSRRA